MKSDPTNTAERASTFEPSPDNTGSPLRSLHTDSVPQILQQLGVSLAVSTYQAGYLILLRADGSTLNTHFRCYARPMGMAADATRLAIGTGRDIAEFRVMGAVSDRLEPPGKHDAGYLPRHAHVTGDIDIHEMVWASSTETSTESEVATPELWFVNTRFSCLCTLDGEHSFRPRWRPPFVSKLTPEDRCHLNGLCLVDASPCYVTALGATDIPEGWRENKVRGGILMDLASDEVVISGLSMPHSPRWYDGRLWMLESGEGSLGTVDCGRGVYEPLIHLDGFTRGLSFVGPFAFVGLSQVRESAVFSGVPIADRLTEEQRLCGVAVVDLRTGEQVGFVHFQDAVQEIFAVEVLPYQFPDVLEWDAELIATCYALPEEHLADVERPRQASDEEDPVE